MGFFQDVTGVGMKTTKYIISSEKLPSAFSGCKIVHLSDFHCKPKKGMVSLVKEEEPDLIFMTGDMADDKEPIDSFLKLLESMLKIAPVYIISGNHDVQHDDYEKLVDICRDMGATYLVNQCVSIKKDEEEIYIYGIDDPRVRAKEKLDEKIRNSISQLKRNNGFEILLFHRANKLPLFENEKFDIIFSGHMHGGQIRLPHLGGVIAPKSSFGDSGRIIFPEFSGGRYKMGETEVVVSCGMGNSVILPRFGNPTEIVSVILKKKE